MRIFAAGILKNMDDLTIESGVKRVLLSFADKGVGLRLELWRSAGAEILVDSGAFSVWKTGKSIDLGLYALFIGTERSTVFQMASLDVIGDPETSFNNWVELRRRGLDVFPTHHLGSSQDHLRRLLDNGAKTVAFGGLAGGAWDGGSRQADERRRWLDEAFSVASGWWPVSIHAFGICTQWVLERYPFASCDSTSPTIGAAMGIVQEFKLSKFLNDKPYQWFRRGPRTPAPETNDDIVGPEVASRNRLLWNLSVQRSYERYLTDLWTARGVVFG